MNNEYKDLFYRLLDEVEQIPHPMAEEAWSDFSNEAKELEDE